MKKILHIKLKQDITLKGILVISLCLYLMILIVSSLCFIDRVNPLANAVTIGLCFCMGCYFLLLLKMAKGNLFELVSFVLLFFLIYFFPRTLCYILYPDIVTLPFGVNVTGSEINKGLLYIFSGTILMFTGMQLADVVWSSCFPHSLRKVDIPQGYSTKSLFVVFFMVFLVNFYFTHILGISPYGKMQAEAYNTIIQFFKVCFEFDATFRIVFSLIYLKIVIGKEKKWRLLGIFVLFYILDKSFSGSRVGVLRVYWAFFGALIVIKPDFNLRISRYVIAAVALCLIAFVIFPIATKFRDRITYSHYEITVDEAILENENSQEYEKDKNMVKKIFGSGINRLGCVLDYSILIITQPYDVDVKEKYMTFLYPLKNIVNSVSPGNPFPEAKIMTSRVVDMVFRTASEKDMYSYYNSEYWTVWGLFHIMFGSVFGLVAMFLIGGLFQTMYVFIVKFFSRNIQFLLKIWFLFYVLKGFISNMGLDDGFITAFQGLIQFVTIMVVLFLADCFFVLLKNSGKTLFRNNGLNSVVSE